MNKSIEDVLKRRMQECDRCILIEVASLRKLLNCVEKRIELDHVGSLTASSSRLDVLIAERTTLRQALEDVEYVKEQDCLAIAHRGLSNG